MNLISTYSCRIHSSGTKNTHSVSEKEFTAACKNTVDIYDVAKNFFINVCLKEWDILENLSSQDKLTQIEKLTIETKTNKYVPYKFNIDVFHKYPCYYRRAAINDAVGAVSSYKSNLKNWEENPVGKKPSLPKAGHSYPTLYRKNTFNRTGKYTAEIKLFINNTWDWVEVKLRKGDADYIEKHCSNKKDKCPVLQKRGKNWSLDFVFEEKINLEKVEPFNCTVLSVDLGINNPATCTVMKSDGTILGRHFFKLLKEEDSLFHAINRIKKAQQNGARKMPRLWAKAKGINKDISSKTAKFIMYWATYYNVDVIVFEHLDLNKKARGSKKQRLHLWRAKEVQRIVEHQAHMCRIRISRICAWGTSKFAYDGSGQVKRNIDNNYSICQFPNGKIYNCDLSASYNIASRYFIREITKSLPAKVRLKLEAKVPQVFKRSTCTYATLISLNAELTKIAL